MIIETFNESLKELCQNSLTLKNDHNFNKNNINISYQPSVFSLPHQHSLHSQLSTQLPKNSLLSQISDLSFRGTTSHSYQPPQNWTPYQTYESINNELNERQVE